MPASNFDGPRLLRGDDAAEGFDCGVPELNEFLDRDALIAQAAGSARTYALCASSKVVAYYSLAPGSVAHRDATSRAVKGLGQYAEPVILLARLAVDSGYQGTGLGTLMLADALKRAIAGASVIGGRAVLVHCRDERARGFYEHHGFEPSRTDPLHLMLLMKDIGRTLGL